ncbi:MAG: hypothetical protein AAFX99_17830 [Myxococcota bacterium]
MTTGDDAHPPLQDRALHWLGIDPRLYTALLGVYLRLDLRNGHFGRATGAKVQDWMSPLFWVVAQYLAIGALLAGVLFARVDARFFAIASLTVSAMVMATALIVEFNEVITGDADRAVLGHQPIPLRTYAAARLTNLLGYVVVMTAALNLGPAIVGMGLRDTGIGWLPTYAGAALLTNLSVSGALVLFYTTLPP